MKKARDLEIGDIIECAEGERVEVVSGSVVPHHKLGKILIAFRIKYPDGRMGWHLCRSTADVRSFAHETLSRNQNESPD